MTAVPLRPDTALDLGSGSADSHPTPPGSSRELPAVAWAAALAGLPSMGPRRLLALLRRWSPHDAWIHATSGDAGLLVATLAPVEDQHANLAKVWRAAGAAVDPAQVLDAHQRAGVPILLLHDPSSTDPAGPERGATDGVVRGSTAAAPPSRWRPSPGYPDVIVDDLEPPAVLFAVGTHDVVDRPRVAIVGTRRCTGTGAGLARELGRELAAAGVAIVSGLAIGIDGAAHRGALDVRASHPEAAPPIGIVGSGIDVVYPARHRDLWSAVAHDGLLMSEAPLGSRPAAWRFPARNRLIAALADVVVVVESHAAGGSLHTVHEAERRDIQVMAVPGSVRSAASAGTNQLLAEGCHPVRDAGDVLVALGLTSGRRRRSGDHRPAPGPTGTAVLDAFDWEPATLEHLVVRTGLPLPEVAVALERLITDRWVSADGGWYERLAAP